MKCAVCGYENKKSAVVSLCDDGIARCKICRDLAMYGKVVRDSEDYPEPTDEWMRHIADLVENWPPKP